MRLFIAINFNDNTRNRLFELRNELRSRSERGNFSWPENLHLTLAFIGECNAEQTAALKAAMDTITFEMFSVNIERVGRFRRKRGDIWWAGVNESRPLLDLQQNLTSQLIAAGFALEKRKYTPHITLGREVVTDVEPWEFESFGEIVGNIDLMKSERIDGKITYKVIYDKQSERKPLC